MQKEIKTALVLGGGGARGAYEIGVWQALREMDIRIDIITGCSVGAINGAMIIQDAFDLSVSLWTKLETNMLFESGLRKKGDAPLKDLLNQYIDETAVRKSTMEYGLVTVEIPAVTPRYLFKEDIPKGKLVDFILASASIFPALLPQNIDNVKYVDGGFSDNLPVDMALQKGATHIIAVDLNSTGIIRKVPLAESENLVRIHSKWDLGSILDFKCSNAERIIRLGYLETLKIFGFYDGGYYCFAKGAFLKREMEAAELAGKIFMLNPAHLYTRVLFDRRLQEAVKSYRQEIQHELQEFNVGIRNRKTGRKGLSNLLQKVNERTLTIIIADFLATHSLTEKTLLTRPVLALFKESFKAANYLVKRSLLS